ncbi:hypothetical protein R3P38DRAFT_3253186 [Favolaschia claudopus]|uniref:Uncharacterized protein n=1 Tax=Favolaschia claudopus TaxID=2862362 RepID=A0AAW0E5U9_9AGAR
MPPSPGMTWRFRWRVERWTMGARHSACGWGDTRKSHWSLDGSACGEGGGGAAASRCADHGLAVEMYRACPFFGFVCLCLTYLALFSSVSLQTCSIPTERCHRDLRGSSTASCMMVTGPYPFSDIHAQCLRPRLVNGGAAPQTVSPYLK